MAEPRRRFGLPPELGVAALVVAASLPLGRLFRSGEIGTVAFAAASGSAATSWGLRRLRAPALVSAAGSLAAFVWFASVAFFRDTMFGPLPSDRSLSLIWHTMVEGVRRSQTDAAPVAATVSFLCLSAFAIWATAWLADDAAVKLRHPMLAIAVTVPLFVLPGTIVEGSRRWIDAGPYLAAAMWVLFQDERFRLQRWGKVVGSGVPGWRPGLAARLGLVVILVALVLTPILPGFSAPPGLQGLNGSGGDQVRLNPLVDIRGQLSSKGITNVFTVQSTVATYWRLTALDLFDGRSWTSATQRPTLKIGSRKIPPQNPSPDAVTVRQRFQIQNLAGPWVPAAWEPVRVDGLRGVGADNPSRSVITSRDLAKGTEFTVTSRIPRLSFEALDAVGPITDKAFDRYLLLPVTPQTRRVARIAQQIIADQGAEGRSGFRQAVALQTYLRTFTYDENVRATLTHDISSIEQFLVEVRRGYCEQFAASMAVLARTLGLPSRVAVGFAVGSAIAADNYQVTSRQAHAWVEIYFAGYGWVPFEPTPRGEGVVVPSYTTPASISPIPTAEPTTEPTPTPTATTTAGRTNPDPERPAGTSAGASGLNKLVLAGIALGGLVVAFLLALPAAPRIRRLLRLRRADGPGQLVTVTYLDFLDWCAASGYRRQRGETPLEHARRLGDLSSNAREPASGLASAATAAVYAPRNGFDPARATALSRTARTELIRSLPKRARLRARMGWGWWRTDPGARRPGRLPSGRETATTIGRA